MVMTDTLAPTTALSPPAPHIVGPNVAGPAVGRGIVARGLRKRYGTTLALDHLDLWVEPGEVFGLIGPNGAGKTTTLRLLAGLLSPDTGTITIGGLDLTRKAARARRLIGYMPDEFGLYDDLRVWEYLDFFGDCYGLTPAERQVSIGELLELVDLTGKRDAGVDKLSRGMRQRLCLAQALIHDPLVLILDEPASGLDPRARVELREILRALAGMGKAVIISSHILSELAEVCDRIGVLYQGRLVAAGTLDEIGSSALGRSLRIRLVPGSDPTSALGITRQATGVAHARLAGEDPTDPAAGVAVPATMVLGSAGSWAGPELIVDFDGSPDDSATLLRALVQGGVAVASFAQHTSTLEELFMTLTEPDDREATR